MSGAIPWSVKGIDPRAREVVRDLARREGLTIGEWLSQAILANEAALADARGEPEGETPERGSREERLAEALRQLAERMEIDDRRNALALAGMDRSLSSLAQRVERAEAHTDEGRVVDLIDELREAQNILHEQMQRIEEEDLPALREGQGGGARIDAIEGDLHILSARALAAETATGEALAKLDGAMNALDAKITDAVSLEQVDARATSLRQSLDAGLDTMAQDVAAMIAETRADIAGQIVSALGGLQPEEMNEALADMSRRLTAAERRHTQTIEAVSIEIKRLSESMDRRLRVVEARNDDNMGAELREEIASMSRAVEHRLGEMETREAAAFSRMGEEVGRIAERLDVRVTHSEARSAGAIEHVGEQVALMAERLTARQDQLAVDVSQRIAQSEEHTAGRLSQALAAISQRLGSIEATTSEKLNPVSAAMDAFSLRLKAIETHAGIPVMLPEAEPPLEPAYLDAPVLESEPLSSPLTRSFNLEHEDDLHNRYTAKEPEQEPAPEPEAREAVYLEDIEEEFERRADEQPSIAGYDVLPVAPTRNLDDPFADIKSAPPEDEDEDLWSTGASANEPPAQAPAYASDDSYRPASLYDDDAPLAEAPSHESLLDDEPLQSRADYEEREMERDVFGAEPEQGGASTAAPPIKEDYLAAARRAAQASATVARAKTNRSAEAPAPAAGLRGVSRVVLWGAAGALAAALAGGVYVYSTHRTGPEKLPQTARKDAMLTTPAPPGSIAEGAALAAAAEEHPDVAANTAPPPAAARAGPLDAIAPNGVQQMSATETTIDAAAAKGDPVAQYELAISKLASGDSANAVGLLRRAANQGLAMAQYRLAKLYERGEGVAANMSEAREWTERAAIAGNRKAMHDLGVYYARGEGAPFDEGAAFKWFRQAAEYGVADSQFNLGVLYSQGRGVAPDNAEALYWFTIAAASGDADARARSAMIAQQLGANETGQVRARARAFKAKPAIGRANGAFGPRPWAPAATLQAAAEVVPRT